jgi:hypothetical protein
MLRSQSGAATPVHLVPDLPGISLHVILQNLTLQVNGKHLS